MLIDRSAAKLLDGSVRELAFAKFWLMLCKQRGGPEDPAINTDHYMPSVPAAANAQSPPPPLGGPFAPLPGLLADALGDVLEIGPGNGLSLPYFSTDKIRTYTAIEPAVEFHEALRVSASVVGLGPKLRIMECGAEASSLLPALVKADDLASKKEGSEVGQSFDAIVSIRSLCSIPDPEKSIQMHYALLRPGGKYIICEHVINPWPESQGTRLGRFMQLFYTALGWPYFVGGCRLSQDTIRMLERAGKWEKVELQRDTDWSALPFVTGVFIK